VAHLTLVVQGREVRKFVLNPAVTTIGRAQENDIVINNLALSRRHAEVTMRRGRFEVEDLGSQNGVFVNNERIDGPKALRDEDTITLGTYQFVFSSDRSGDPDIRGLKTGKKKVEVTQLEDPDDLEPPDQATPLLVLKYNDVELQRFPIYGECLVGRAKECDVQIAERRLSRRHCKLVFDNGRVTLEDLGSQNGTYVNRKRIPRRYDLEHGDVLNFAEYSILYLSDAADYDGPDRENASVPVAPRPASGIEREETEFPEAYGEDYEEAPRPSILPNDSRIHPQDLEDPDDIPAGAPVHHVDPAEPFVERPRRSRERRTREPEREAPEPERRRRRPPPSTPAPRKERVVRGRDVVAKPTKKPRRPSPHVARPIAARVEAAEHADVDDRQRVARPDSALDDWFAAREDDEEYEEEPSVLLERSKSSMSQLLSTMMVDKRELDRNLSVRAKQRRFNIEVKHGNDVVYNGPLLEQVTILGRDQEADIQIKGRYVAARHSLLVRVKDSLLLVRLGSSSAARVNGLPKLQAFLKSGDVVQIDETTIKILEE
jgi:pSer/pThr/pTyr-binding forkhead associated (FHA) protein